MSCSSKEYSSEGSQSVFLSLSFSSFFLLLLLPPPFFIFSVLSSFLPSLLIRMGHVLVGRGRRQCPSAAACQRRRSAVLQTVSTPWWVSYSVALFIKYKFYIPLHEIFNVQCMHQRSVGSQAFESVKRSASSEVKWHELGKSVDDNSHPYLTSRLRGLS